MVDTDPNRSLKGKGVATIETFLGELYNPNNSAGATIAAEYDLIYVDFVQSDEYIQANAHTLKEVINWVNQQKSYAGSTEPNVIMGQSMGGLITRYALKKMESQGIPHQTSVYVSHDAPHLGANIPLGILYTVYAFNSFLENKSNLGGIVNSYGGSYIDLVKRIMHSNAARQMLVNYVDFGGHLNNTDHNLWQQELAALGFPQGDPSKQFRMLSIVNGSYVSSPKEPYIVDANINANSPLLDLLGGINGIFMGILVQDLWAGLLTVLPGKTQLMIKMQMLPGTAVGTKISDFEVKYVKKFLWTVPITRTLFSYQKICQMVYCLIRTRVRNIP
ncbi:hypothetical protein OKW96_12175 [Sphingobacterium sp. KU25419]|nr:hypothetical protein OKW96_12175 [Sphingobacterium sp. KU25419]